MEPHHPRTSLFQKLPPDVIVRVARNTVSRSCGIPTPSDLGTLFSLILTCRKFYNALSVTRNPDLYVKICRLMCDVDAVQRRLGPQAAMSPHLLSELTQRVNLLRRIKNQLIPLVDFEGDVAGVRTLQNVLTAIYLVIMDNEGKNQQQLQDAQIGPFIDRLFSHLLETHLSPKKLGQNPCFSLVVSLMWLTHSLGSRWSCTQSVLPDAIVAESPEHREAILDFLQPFVILPHHIHGVEAGSFDKLEHEWPSTSIKHFGVSVKFTPPPLTPFARLCTVARFNAAKEILNSPVERSSIVDSGSGSTCIPGLSHQLDEDWQRAIAVESSSVTGSEGYSFSRPTLGYTPGTLEGTWQGAFFTPYSVCYEDDSRTDVQMCQKAMQCRLREYHSFKLDDTLRWIDDKEDEEGHALGRAWFPEGIDWYETTTSLMIYDPTRSRWLRYWRNTPPTVNHSPRNSTVLDTFIIGTSMPSDQAGRGEFKFHGRVRPQDGWVALVRTPDDTPVDSLGAWVFHGQVHAAYHFVGDWRVTATALYTPGRQGWFSLSKEKM